MPDLDSTDCKRVDWKVAISVANVEVGREDWGSVENREMPKAAVG